MSPATSALLADRSFSTEKLFFVVFNFEGQNSMNMSTLPFLKKVISLRVPSLHQVDLIGIYLEPVYLLFFIF